MITWQHSLEADFWLQFKSGIRFLPGLKLKVWKWSCFAQIFIALVWDLWLHCENKLKEIKHENTVKRCDHSNFSPGWSNYITSSLSCNSSLYFTTILVFSWAEISAWQTRPRYYPLKHNQSRKYKIVTWS